MYSLGTAPPLMSLSNWKPSAPSVRGSNLIFTLANWPEPPDCFLCVCSISQALVMHSRYATCGAPTCASTRNSRLRRSTMISRWSSPIPEMTVCPDSSSRLKRKEGSSCASLMSASVIFSMSPLVLGSTATEMTGSGNSIFSRITGLDGSQSVSPVVVSLQPTRAMMSPAKAWSMSVRSLAFISSMRPMRSFLFLTELSTVSPLLSTPE
mmetsp:Transcript_20431/g.60309  ORF Transcript_20431/g.60309 Transcript_20431/m.60309 type:complete len:209 (-) Transcript_20431:1127-1753(-)